MSTERVNQRLEETRESVKDGMQLEEEHVARVREQAAELRREQRRNAQRARTIEALHERWQSVLDRNQFAVEASDKLFGDPRNVDKANRIQDGENRPGKGEAEVERVYADSLLIPLGVGETGIETFGALRLWGIFRGGDAGRKSVYTPTLHFGERSSGRDFFDVFHFDSYDVFYVAGVDQKPEGSDMQPMGKDLTGREIYGKRVTEQEGQDENNVDRVLRFTTIDSNSQAWMSYALTELKNPEIPEGKRKEYLAYVRKSMAVGTKCVDDYITALDELLLATTRVTRTRSQSRK